MRQRQHTINEHMDHFLSVFNGRCTIGDSATLNFNETEKRIDSSQKMNNSYEAVSVVICRANARILENDSGHLLVEKSSLSEFRESQNFLFQFAPTFLFF